MASFNSPALKYGEHMWEDMILLITALQTLQTVPLLPVYFFLIHFPVICPIGIDNAITTHSNKSMFSHFNENIYMHKISYFFNSEENAPPRLFLYN